MKMVLYISGMLFLNNVSETVNNVRTAYREQYHFIIHYYDTQYYDIIHQHKHTGYMHIWGKDRVSCRIQVVILYVGSKFLIR